MNPRFVTNEEALLRGSRNPGGHGILSTLGRLLTNLDNFDHPGCVPDHPCFEGVRFLTTLDRFLTTQVLRGVRFLTTLDRFLAPPNFRGVRNLGRVPRNLTPLKIRVIRNLTRMVRLG